MQGETPASDRGQPDAALAERAHHIRQRIAAAAGHADRDPTDVTLIAVTKTISVERMLDAAALGLTRFGENRVQEAQDKRERIETLARLDDSVARLASVIRYDLIGHLQTNKAGRAASMFDRIQSVDSARLAEALNKRAIEAGKILSILLEVNVGGEESKSGFAPSDIESAAREICAMPGLSIQGLMTVAPFAPDPEQARPVFRTLRELRDYLRGAAPLGENGWRELSMGMTDDFDVAIEEGATIVRIGRGLFGSRPPITRQVDGPADSQ